MRRTTVSGRRAVVGLLALVTAGMVAGCGILPREGVTVHPKTVLPIPPNQQLTTITVQQGAVINSQQVAGQIVPLQTALLYFNTAGKILTLNMTNGGTVIKGQVLATLDSGDLSVQISQQKLTIQRDQLHIDDLQTSATLSPPTTPGEAAQRTADLQNAEIQLKGDQLDLEHMQIQLSQYQIVAPFAGKVLNLKNHLGDYVNQYEVLAELQDTSAGRFVAQLTATQAQVIAPGQPVVLTLSSDPQNKLDTTVNSVQIPSDNAMAIAQANQGIGLANPQVTLAIPGSYTFKPDDVGVAFTAIVTVAERDNVIYLPNGLAHQFNGFDFVYSEVGGQVVQAPVTLGLQGNQYVEVTAGLNAGDIVVQQ